MMENNLKALLEERDLSISELARQTDIAPSTLNRIVNGKVNIDSISVVHFLKLAHGLGLTVEQLYYGDMNYEANKHLIDRAYTLTSTEGRRAMVANAIGVARAYGPSCESELPSIRDCGSSCESALPPMRDYGSSCGSELPPAREFVGII